MSPAILLDRDGVLNPTVSEHGLTRAPKYLADFQLLPEVREALQRLAERFPIAVLTNQAEVARGLIKRDEVKAIHD